MFSKRMSNRNTFYVFYAISRFWKFYVFYFEYLYETYLNTSWYLLDTVPVLIYSLTIFKPNSRTDGFVKYLLYSLSQLTVLKYF